MCKISHLNFTYFTPVTLFGKRLENELFINIQLLKKFFKQFHSDSFLYFIYLRINMSGTFLNFDVDLYLKHFLIVFKCSKSLKI